MKLTKHYYPICLVPPATLHAHHDLRLTLQGSSPNWHHTLHLDTNAVAPRKFLLWEFPQLQFQPGGRMHMHSDTHSELIQPCTGSPDMFKHYDLSDLPPQRWIRIMYGQIQKCPASVMVFVNQGKISLVTGGPR